ncbi:MAG: tRNA pseudouridine(38-40) synthase TruA [Bacteroidota bacterium]
MHRYFVQLSFKGTRYHGWQIQPNAISVQEVLENAFTVLLQEKVGVVGAGRTDTGVHASFYVLHFDVAKAISDLPKMVYRLNSFLPSDIAIQKIWKVPQDAHARFSALSRTYKYFITLKKDPFSVETEYYLRLKPDVFKMNEAAQILMDCTDFTSFSKLHSDVKTNICNVCHAEWTVENNRLVFTIKADRFLRNMVRAVVGTLLDVGKGKIAIEDFKRIIGIQNRGAAGASAPAHGLYLVDVEYPEAFMG